MSDKDADVWETFDALYQSVNRQGRRVEELEARIVELERKLAEHDSSLRKEQAS